VKKENLKRRKNERNGKDRLFFCNDWTNFPG